MRGEGRIGDFGFWIGDWASIQSPTPDSRLPNPKSKIQNPYPARRHTSPRAGAKRKTRRKTLVETKTMAGPEAMLM